MAAAARGKDRARFGTAIHLPRGENKAEQFFRGLLCVAEDRDLEQSSLPLFFHMIFHILVDQCS